MIPDKRRLPKSQWKMNIYHDILDSATLKLIDHLGTVYRDELQKSTGLNNEIVTMWLKKEKFVKPGYAASKRWVNREWLNNRVQLHAGASPAHGIPRCKQRE
jgi:hypothetical protein